ncbi:DUF4880 domain-containing protein [Pseudomonas sp. DTU_2021_1001937_2_SI_NGA_ILE_001]|uniref:DUF4880 domain-containing protein n=1 Tax=Pseudomonas sp. DTU_2021_1001937_2_SI_NGA_ILE_001 TaxID=3077589 RepID=UPI0028FC0D7D|nr:DUF4880 domain-containing protein [Pseudomonas sp. DTU_2021_1001937_2_SI_NGA_ILE_001]WNW12496.1 DUF4880 domain-containing protein [Pseudomonas sp. DTU_2021_1001937_2_SI_NGA_ILE_001]
MRKAIEWSLRLKGTAPPELHEQCRQWRAADACHELAWQRVKAMSQELDGTFGQLPAGMAYDTLEGSARRLDRRRALKLLSAGLVLGTGAWLSRDATPWRVWTADFATAVGQCSDYPLADGGRLRLNTDSAVNRRDAHDLFLERGEMLLGCTRPMQVATRGMHLEVPAGRLVLRQDSSYKQLSVLEGTVRLSVPGQSLLEVGKGEHYRLDAQGLRRLTSLDMEPEAWADGLIVTRGIRLADFLAEVARYRHGYLGCAAEVADLRLSGVYRLDDTDRLLAVLPRTLPVRLAYRTRWWVSVQGQA